VEPTRDSMQQGVVVCHGYRGIDKFVRVVVSPPSTPLSTPLGVDLMCKFYKLYYS